MSSADGSPASGVNQEDTTSCSIEAQSSSTKSPLLPESSETSDASPTTTSSSGIGSSRTGAHHQSNSSISSGAITSTNDNVFTDGTSPTQEPSTTTTTTAIRPQSTSPDKGDGCLPDSTTSNLTSPFGLQQNGKTNDNASGDFGYSSGSDSSLRDRLMSSDLNSGRSGAGTCTLSSVPSLSVNSLVGSLPPPTANTTANMTTSNSEFHSQNMFHPASTFYSNGIMTVAGNPPYQLPSMDPNGSQFTTQSQPISGSSFSIHTGTQFGPQLGQEQMNIGDTVPQQFLQQNHKANGNGVNPANYLPDWIPGPSSANFNPSSSSLGYADPSASNVPFQGAAPMGNFQTMGGPGFQYIEPSLSSSGSAQEVYNPPPITTSGSNTFMESVPGTVHLYNVRCQNA